MDPIAIVHDVLRKQGKRSILPGELIIPVDIILKNGNIPLLEFRILSLQEDLICGLTKQEAYCALRENRDFVYCYLRLSEIKELKLSHEHTLGAMIH
ncbi:MAG: hypothetical protein MUF42_00760 [Cytophagaceae bacterium]|jgi:hypothetical protein|nr:hypothetical protein [Cytophagaceae bacterium]